MDGGSNAASAVASRAKKRAFWWPEVGTLEGANAAIRTAFWTAVFVASVTTVLAVYAMVNGPIPILGIDGYAVVDGVLFGILSVFLFRGSRVAAVLALAFYTGEWIYALGDRPGNSGMAMRVIFSL